MSWAYQPLLPAAAFTPATLYWVGGAGTWDQSTATNWAETSGGIGGAGIPEATTAVIFDNNSGTGTVTIDNGVCSDLTLTSTVSAVTLTPTTSGLSIYGSVLIQGTGATISGSAAINFVATTSETITSGGETFDCPVTFNGVGGTWQLQDNMTVGSTRTTTLTNGALDLNGKNFSTGIFSSNNSNTRSVLSSTATTIFITYATTATVWDTGNAPSPFSSNITIDITDNHSGATKTVGTGAAIDATFNFRIGGNGTTFILTGNPDDVTITNTTCTINNTLLTIYGNLNIQGTSPTFAAGTSSWSFTAAAGTTNTITTNGKTLDFPLFFQSNATGTIQLVDNLTIGATREVTLANGILDLNGKIFSVDTFKIDFGSTKNITFNGGTLSIYGSIFNNASPSGFTTTTGTGAGKISMSSASSKTFEGAGSTYNCILENAGAGALTIYGNNTITTISNSVQPTTFRFTAGSTQTVTNFSVSGTSGNLVTINSTSAGSPATLSKASGTVSVSFCSIKDSTATGGATWQAYTFNGNVNNGGNTGWAFLPPTAGYVKIYMGAGPGWVYKPVKTWDGAQWVIKPAKWYNSANTSWDITKGL